MFPPELYVAWARALGLAPKVFARTMLGFYDPITHDLLFGPPDPANDRGRPGCPAAPIAAAFRLRDRR